MPYFGVDGALKGNEILKADRRIDETGKPKRFSARSDRWAFPFVGALIGSFTLPVCMR